MNRLALALTLVLAGCVAPPERAVPFGGLEVQGQTYPDLSVALMLSNNTKNAAKYAARYEAARPPLGGALGADKLDEQIAAVFRRNFKSVSLAESFEGAAHNGADVVVMLDLYADFPNPRLPGNAKIDLKLKYLAPDRTELDAGQFHINSNGSFFSSAAQNIEAATSALVEKLDHSIKDSAKLHELNRLRSGLARTAISPSPAAESAVRSDIDSPGYRLTERPDDFAVVVGIEGYSSELPPARYAERDAEVVKEHLLAQGLPERNIKLLLGSRASKANLEAYLEDWLPKNARADGRVFFYFSGHGAPDASSSQAYLVPWDGNPNFLDRTGYSLRKLYADLGAIKARQVVVALDSCFSGAGGRSVLAENARPLITKLETAPARDSKLVLFAASAPQEITGAIAEQQHGVFTYFFLKGLSGAAKDSSGAVTARGLYEYLKPKVEDEASRQNREQTPAWNGPDAELARF